MKTSVIALDYDGTIARHDRLDPSVREAIAFARARGITVLLVTGRILDELRRVAGDLHFVDGVVAENGAVTHYPESGHSSTLAAPIPAAFTAALTQQGIRFTAGQCLVDTDADAAPRLLEIIRRLELPLVLAFNAGRVMTLPQGVSKATGLRAALDTLRLSPRNALAVGDAENDHELLRFVELGAAVEWGSGTLRAAADTVVTGQGPDAVARYVHGIAEQGHIPIPAHPRRRLRLGYTDDGREFSLEVRGRNLLVAGDAKSGKSWVAGLLCEQLILFGYCVCVIDPEGDYRSLEALPGVTILGGEEPPPRPRELLRVLRYPDRSVVIDLSHLPQDGKIEYIRAVLPVLNTLRRHTGLPHRIVVDEAHYFLHDAAAHHLLDLELNGYTVVTYCASRLPRELLAATEAMVVTCESNPMEIEALRRLCSACDHEAPERWAALGHLRSGQAMALPITAETCGELTTFTLGPRLTPHVRHREKYVDVPVSDQRAFVFAHEGRIVHRARTLREFVTELERAGAEDALAGYLRRGDFSRWVGDVFGDYALAEEIHALERAYVAGARPEADREIANAIRERYDVSEKPEGVHLPPVERAVA